MNPEFPEACTAKGGHCAHMTGLGKHRMNEEGRNIFFETFICCHCGARARGDLEDPAKLAWHGPFLPLGRSP